MRLLAEAVGINDTLAPLFKLLALGSHIPGYSEIGVVRVAWRALAKLSVAVLGTSERL